MPWVAFWALGRCASGHNDKEVQYIWYDQDPNRDPMSRECTYDYAGEIVPHWMQGGERGYQFGYEVLEGLPPEIRKKLLEEYQERMRHDERMIQKILEAPTTSWSESDLKISEH